MDMASSMSWMMALGMVLWLVVIAGIVAAIVWYARRTSRPPRDEALDILRARYARGEIAREEYEARRRDLIA